MKSGRAFTARIRKRGPNPYVDALARRTSHPRLLRVEQPVPGWYAHVFRFRQLSDFDAGFARLAREAYGVGRREHLR